MAQVPNPYRVAIKGRWDHASSDITDLRTILDSQFSLLRQAWVGGSSEQACDQLDHIRQQLSSDATACDTTFRDAYQHQPQTVDEDAWQTRWRLIGW